MYKLLVLFVSLTTFAEVSDFQASQIETDYISKIELTNNKNKSAVLDDVTLGGFNDLLEFVVPAPAQEDAGSCLYMSHTGVVEWWYNKLHNLTGESKVNFSERHYMALKTRKTNQEKIQNWRTDNIQRINKDSKIHTNDQYRFTKGHYKKVNKKRVVTTESDEDAVYGTQFNWIDLVKNVENKSSFFDLPEFDREVIFAVADQNQWAVGQAPKDIVSRIKEALHKRKAPVLVIYNHKGFWHANYVFGYNDNASTQGCPYVTSYKPRMDEKAQAYLEKAKEAKTDSRRVKYEKTAKKYIDRGNIVQDMFEEIGCRKKGVFYVRDSIYPNDQMPSYDYDLAKTGEEDNLNAPLITREYEWAETTLNHAIQIYPKGM